MKEYDIYLRKRLTEADIIIQNLKYRDYFSVSSSLILRALDVLFTAQKSVACELELTALSEIDELLKKVHEHLDYGLAFNSDAEAFIQIFNLTKENALCLITEELPISIYSILSMLSGFCIGASVKDESLEKLFEVSQGVELTSAVLGAGKNIFEEVKSILAIEPCGRKDGMPEWPDLLYRYEVGADSSLSLSTKLNASLSRFRRLEEVDDFTLNEIDTKTLNDLDYVLLY